METSKKSDHQRGNYNAVLSRPALCENGLDTSSSPINNVGCHNVSMIESISEYLEVTVPSRTRGRSNGAVIPQRRENKSGRNDDMEHPSPSEACDSQESVYHSGTSSVTKWEMMFQRLLEFKEKHGHCLVPNRFKDDKKLGLWVSMQRRQYKAYSTDKFDATALSMDRIRRLEDIGFVWSASKHCRVEWDVRFLQLQAFFHHHGMCRHSDSQVNHAWREVKIYATSPALLSN